MIKLKKIIVENKNITPFHEKALKVMLKKDLGDDLNDIWNFLTEDLFLEDIDLKTELLHLYLKYYNSEDLDLTSISNDDFGDMDENFSDEEKALSSFLNIPPILLEREKYNHFSLSIYKDITSDEEYAIGTDEEAERAHYSYYDDMCDIDNLEHYFSKSFLIDNIDLDSDNVRSYVEDEVYQRINDLDEDEVIEMSSYDKSEIEDEISDLEYEIEDIELEIDYINDEIESLKESKEDGDYDDNEEEYLSLLNVEIGKLNEFLSSKEEKENEISNKKTELEDLYNHALDEVTDSLISETLDEIEDIGHFIDRGYEIKDAINYFGDYDKDEFIEKLISEDSRGSALASYDGYENYEIYDGIVYYIYRIN